MPEKDYNDQDLEMCDEPREFVYKDKTIQVYPISTVDAIRLLGIQDKIASATPDAFEREFGENGQLFQILSHATHKSAKSLAKQTPTFLMWLVNRILEVTDVDFFSKEASALQKRVLGVQGAAIQPSSEPSDTSPEEKGGQ